MKNRGFRRHQLEKRKKKIRNRWLNEWRDRYYRALPEEELKECINREASTRKRCSCYMCGNVRKYFKEKTLQEKKFLEDVFDQERMPL